MEKTNQDAEQQIVDSVLSVDARALKVWEYLQQSDFSTWDLVCFCAEYIGMISGTYPWLEEIAKRQAILVWKCHTLNIEEISKWDRSVQEFYDQQKHDVSGITLNGQTKKTSIDADKD